MELAPRRVATLVETEIERLAVVFMVLPMAVVLAT